jgi:vacuolar-type H+-ATPase subunit F/Vma7
MAKGIFLERKDHEEIKKIMEEYRNLEIPAPLINAKKEAKQPVKKIIEKKVEWKPYPVD